MSSLTPSQFDALVQFLRGIPLFSHMQDEDLHVLIGLAKHETFPLGREIYRQSDDDKKLYIINTGQVRLIHIDPTGAPNEVAIVGPGQMLGETSLLLAEPHDVTALTISNVTAVVFQRDTFMPLREQYPRLWGRLNPSEPVAQRLKAQPYAWLTQDESVVKFTRQHWWGVMRRMFFPLVALLGILAFVFFIQQSLPTLVGLVAFLGAAALIGIVAYMFIEWRNDYWVVTNKRIVHVDEIIFIRKKRNETPLPSITQIQHVRHGLAAALLDFGDLEVETFTGSVGMRDVPSPTLLKQEIQHEVEKLRARQRATERKTIRDDLEKLMLSQNEPATSPAPQAPAAPAEEEPKSISVLTGLLNYFFPKLVDRREDTIIWRRHWAVLWRRALWPAIGMLVVGGAASNWFFRLPPLGYLMGDNAWWIWPILFSIMLAWWWWEFEDWRIDEYRLTGKSVIEIERTPFSLNERRRESSLSDFQSTELKQVGPWQKLFRYGTLSVKLPGAKIDFRDIVNPAAAQAEINKRLAACNAEKAKRDAQARHNELTDWFAAYDEIRQRDRVRDTSTDTAPRTLGGENSNDSA